MGLDGSYLLAGHPDEPILEGATRQILCSGRTCVSSPLPGSRDPANHGTLLPRDASGDL